MNYRFQCKRGKYIAISKYGATWVNSTKKHVISFDKKISQNSNKLLTRSVFFLGCWQFASHQTISSPMGCDLAPFIANLFLVTY